MRTIRNPNATVGSASNQPPHMAYMRHRAAQVRAQSVPTAQKKYLAARAKGALTPIEALNQMRRGQLKYNRTKATHNIGSMLGPAALSVLDATTGIPSIVGAIRSAHGDLNKEVSSPAVLGLVGGMRGPAGKSGFARIGRRAAIATGGLAVAAYGSQALKPHLIAPSYSRSQRQEDVARRGFLSDIQYLRETGQMAPARAQQLHDWAMTPDNNDLYRGYRISEMNAHRKIMRAKGLRLPPLTPLP